MEEKHPEGLLEEKRMFFPPTALVVLKIGAIARPDDIFLTAELPKTRSGKIMRRLLKDIAEGRDMGDTSTLADVAVINFLKENVESRKLLEIQKASIGKVASGR